MANPLLIDIEVDDDLKAFLTPPECPTIKLPKLGKAEVCLPLGGRMQGMVDARNAVPDDCAVNFALLLQLPPLMASIECLIKVLGLVKPLIDVVSGISPPDPGKLATAIPDFIKAANKVLPCFAQIAIGVPMFVRDLVLLIAKTLHCVAEVMHSIAKLMGGLELSIQTAQQSGNSELLAQLQCQKENAQNQAEAAMNNIDLIAAILALAEPFFGLAPGVPKIVLPTFGNASDAESIDEIATALEELSAALIKVAEALPGCA